MEDSRLVPAVLRTPRDRWIEAGLAALVAGGPHAVRVEVLAKELGVTKGGFYGHFADRDELLVAMLEHWEQASGDDMLAEMERTSGPPLSRMERARALTLSPDLQPMDLAIRAWARHDPSVAAVLRRVDGVRMEYLRSQFSQVVSDPDEIEARATLAFTMAIGIHYVGPEHGGRPRDQVIDHAVRLLGS